ncbi:hypothetical protein V7S43_002575 [Phytophthora oleae]|uniref:Uncharacterized protein n=1 Tax=Phytophthora oleae TaxID=2107226 RepID=A0ABD3FZW0_9STRA
MARQRKMDNLMRKLTPTPRSRAYLKRFIEQTFKIPGVLLAFHLLNVLVAIGGVISVAFLLASMALMPIWIVVASVLDAIQQIEKKCLSNFGYVVLAVLHLVLLSINWYVAAGIYVIVAAGALGVGLFFVSAVAMKFLVKIDVISANFAPIDDPEDVHDPDECQDRFKLSEPTNGSHILPHIRMTRCLWLAVAYFASFKLLAGVVGMTVLDLCVVIPALLLFSANDALAFMSHAPFGDNPIGYIILITCSWLLLFPVMTVLLVITTRRFYDFGQEQTDDFEIPVTPSPELTSTNFAEIDPRAPGVPVGAAAAV